MANEVKIKLTDAQKEKIREATCKDMPEIRVEHFGSNPAVSPTDSKLSTSVSARKAGRYVIGADQTLALGERLFNKPEGRTQALERAWMPWAAEDEPRWAAVAVWGEPRQSAPVRRRQGSAEEARDRGR